MKVTPEVYKNIKKGKAPAILSKRTIRNVEKSLNYDEYRKKYCVKKKEIQFADLYSVSDTIVNLIDIQHEKYYFIYKKNVAEINKLLLIILLVNVICSAIIIGLIAW